MPVRPVRLGNCSEGILTTAKFGLSCSIPPSSANGMSPVFFVSFQVSDAARDPKRDPWAKGRDRPEQAQPPKQQRPEPPKEMDKERARAAQDLHRTLELERRWQARQVAVEVSWIALKF